jgi:hypothetical protein
MTQALIQIEDDDYARLKARAEARQMSVEQYLASLVKRAAEIIPPESAGTFGEFLDSIADIHFETSGPWTRDELYER